MKNNNFYFLHLEGLDLAGKSTISKLIKEKSTIEWKINNNKLTENNPIYDFTNELGRINLYDDEVYGNLYFVALMADVKSFTQETNIIQDSTLLLRSINYHTEKGNSKLVKQFEDLIKKHPVPDLSIYLTANIDARRKRLDKILNKSPEKLSKNDLLILNDPKKFIEMDKELARLSEQYFNSVILDTSDLSLDEVVDYIYDLLNFENKKLKILY